LSGKPKIGSQLLKIVTVRTFLTVLAAVYVVAFISFGVQARGLIGTRGILPLTDFLQAVRTQIGPSERSPRS
jgi:hypothetical protein